MVRLSNDPAPEIWETKSDDDDSSKLLEERKVEGTLRTYDKEKEKRGLNGGGGGGGVEVGEWWWLRRGRERLGKKGLIG